MLTLLLAALPLYAADADALLALHNTWRSSAGAPPLSWDDALAQEAQARAEALQSGPIATDPDAIGSLVGMLRIVGENVSAGTDLLSAARRWASEQPPVPCTPATETAEDAPQQGATSPPEGSSCTHHATAVAPYALRLGCGWAEPVLVCRYATP